MFSLLFSFTLNCYNLSADLNDGGWSVFASVLKIALKNRMWKFVFNVI